MTQTAAAVPPRIVQFPLEQRDAEISSVDAKARTVEVIWTTGAAVRRMDWYTGEMYDEVLEVSERAVDMSRLNNGAPLLESHNSWSLRGVIGVVEKAWLADGKGYATVRFTSEGIDPDTDKTFLKVQDGIIRKISAGYATRKAEWDRSTTPPIRRAISWQPFEISFVSVGADDGAGRRAEGQMFACEITERAQPASEKETTMKNPTAPAPEQTRSDPENPPPTITPTPPAPPAPDLRAAGIEWERNRQRAIRARVDASGLPSESAQRHIDSGVDPESNTFRDLLIDELAQRGGSQRPPSPRIGTDNTDPAVLIERMSDALALRGMMHLPAAQRDAQIDTQRQAAARQYMSMGLLTLFTDVGMARGMKIDHRMPRSVVWDQLVANRSLSTSDFPLLLSAAANKIMLPAYNLGAGAYFSIAARKTFNDFKAHNFLRAGDFPNLLQKDETGEFKYGTLSESNQAITALEYGRIVRVSRQIIINDDMSAFTDLPRMAGVRAAAVANKLGFDLFALNAAAGPTITEPNTAGVQTGVAMWEAAVHKNLTTGPGTAIDDTTIGVGVGLMLAQLSMDGIPLNDLARPRYILAAPGKIGLLRKYTALLTSPSSGANVNPWGGELLPLTDGNLTGNAWYLFADPANVPCFIYGYLTGQEGPRMASQEGFTTEGVDLRVAMDYAAGGIDFRGTYKNTGA